MAQTLYEILEEYTNFKKSYSEKLKESLFETFKEFFENNPQVSMIEWDQYTPYFRDGDPCYFSVCTPFFTLNSEESESYNVYDIEDSFFRESDVDEEALCNLLGTVEDPTLLDVLEEAFGDHAHVTVTSLGFSVTSIEHD